MQLQYTDQLVLKVLDAYLQYKSPLIVQIPPCALVTYRLLWVICMLAVMIMVWCQRAAIFLNSACGQTSFRMPCSLLVL